MRRLRLAGWLAISVKVASLAVAGFLVAVFLGSGAAGAVLTVLDGTPPELHVAKSAPEQVNVDAVFDYRIDVTNTGGGTATSVVVTDALPAGIDVVSHADGCRQDGTSEVVVTCDVGSIEPQGTFSTTITVKGTATRTVVNTAQASATNAGPASGSATTVIGDTTLIFDKSGPATATAGARIQYQLFVENTGSVKAFAVQVKDFLPAGVSGVEWDGTCALTQDDTVLVCAVGDLPVDSHRYIAVSFVVATPSTVTNRAQVSSSNVSPDPEDSDSVSTTVESGTVDLGVTKTGPPSAFTGQPVAYTIAVTNDGNLDATGTKVRENLPANSVLVSALLGSQVLDCPVTSGSPICPLGTIEPDQTKTLTVTIQRSTAGQATNSVDVFSDTEDANGGDNSSSTTTTFTATDTGGPHAVINDLGCRANELPRNDDGSTGAVPLGFTANFFGTTYTHTFVNNNGNVTFGNRLGTFTPFALNASTPPIIAPFFADVDTGGSASDTVHYSFGPITFNGRPAFCVDWVNVGYYSRHTDKLNSFQLLLVDRSDVGTGDFDMVFNYDRLLWETGDASGGSGGFGGTSAGAGYSAGNGDPAAFFQMPGSRVNRALLDSNAATGLVRNSRGTLQLGRYVFPVRNGAAPAGGAIAGTIRDSSENPIPGAPVQICPASGGLCAFVTATNGAGAYNATGLPARDYTVAVFPPAGSSLSSRTVGPLTVVASSALTQDIVLTSPTPPPAGTSISPARVGGGGIPVVFWNEPLRLSTTGCTGGAATYQVTEHGAVASTGAMVESPSGTYTATIPQLSPVRGLGLVRIALTCPNPAANASVEFNVYIDPSGVVRTAGGSPIAGVRVTLLRADSSAGPFLPVQSGSSIMSPLNRTNPDQTDAEGHFGWDVIAGFYVVRAEKSECHAPGNPAQAFVESPVLTIPPPVTDLDLRLTGPGCADPSVVTAVTAATAQTDSVVGSLRTVSATVRENEIAQVGKTVSFRVISGPHQGTQRAATTDATGTALFSYTGAAVGTDAIEASYVDSSGATQTSNRVFVTWVAAPPPPTPTETTPVTKAPAPPPPPPDEPGTFNGQVTAGIVLFNGQTIRGLIELESGDVVDATNGRIEIASDGGRAEFFDGAFKITQPSEDNTVTRLELVGGDFSSCGARKTAGLRADDKPVRRLWGKGTGKFETKARYSSATVRGTTWLTEDRCDGSLTRAETGTVRVYDLSLRRTRVLEAGSEYVAEAPPPPTPGNFLGDVKGQVIVNGALVDQDTQIRSGDTIDVRNGRIELTTTSGQASFFSGRFLVEQTGDSSAFTLLTLIGGDFSSCSTAAKSRSLSSTAEDPPKKAVRSLWGTGKGKFRTKSRFSAATVRGTNWLTVDRCDGSLTVVREGLVEVYDVTLDRTVQVGPGKQYLAPARRG